MRRFILFVLFIFSASLVNSQNDFEYQRDWSTYFGPLGSYPWIESGTPPLLFDSQNNIYVSGSVRADSINYTASYYNQFKIGDGGQDISLTHTSGNTTNLFYSRFNPSGIPELYEYCERIIQLGYRKKLLYIDSDDNLYYEYASRITDLPYLPTVNAWRQEPTDHIRLGAILAKESQSGTLIWASYVPLIPQAYVHSVGSNLSVTGDDEGNIYVSGVSHAQEGVTTPGTFQEEYQLMYSGSSERPNAYLVKLNSSNGSLIWGTYLPSRILRLKYYNNSLYLIGSSIHPDNQIDIATPNAFQTEASSYYIQKFNATNGTREWGTYYGHTTDVDTAGNDYHLKAIEVSKSGIYIIGYAMSDETTQGYFGTPGSHQPTNSGNYDLFLSKFNHNGGREWSTYFGGPSTEILQGAMQPLAIDDKDNVYIAGSTRGTDHNLATPGSYKSTPTSIIWNNYNHFFAKFNSSGERIWCSYYGDSTGNLTSFFPINIAIHNSSLYLYGETGNTTGYTTPGCWQSEIIDPNPSAIGASKKRTFLAKFDLNPLSTPEKDKSSELVLYSNPNNGIFNLQGDIFTTEKCVLEIYDVSGKLVHTQPLNSEQIQEFNLSNKLASGNYFLTIKNSRNLTLKNFKMIVK